MCHFFSAESGSLLLSLSFVFLHLISGLNFVSFFTSAYAINLLGDVHIFNSPNNCAFSCFLFWYYVILLLGADIGNRGGLIEVWKWVIWKNFMSDSEWRWLTSWGQLVIPLQCPVPRRHESLLALVVCSRRMTLDSNVMVTSSFYVQVFYALRWACWSRLFRNLFFNFCFLLFGIPSRWLVFRLWEFQI